MPLDTPSRAANPASGAPMAGEMQTLLNPALNKVSPILITSNLNRGEVCLGYAQTEQRTKEDE